MPEFVRVRHDGLDAETVLPLSALPHLAGWERVDEPPAVDEDAVAAVDDALTSLPAAPASAAPRPWGAPSPAAPIEEPTDV